MKKIIHYFSFLTVILLSLPSQSQNIYTIAGNGYAGYSGDGGQAILAECFLPSSVVIDKSGYYYFTDQENSRIRKVDTGGIITTISGNGVFGFSGDGGAASNAELNAPNGVSIDDSGNIYFADYDNNRIRKIELSSGIITTVAGNGYGGYSGDGSQAIDAELNLPACVIPDNSGNIYIADGSNNCVRKVSTAGEITTVAGNGTGGYGGDGGPATLAELNSPTGLAMDVAGNIYIADQGNSRIRIITSSGLISTYAGNGTAGYNGNGGQATAAEINSPCSIGIDKEGDIYFVDLGNFVIRTVNTSGIINTVAGNGISYFSGDGGPATNAALEPEGVAVDTNNFIYIADDGNMRIRRVDTTHCAVTMPSICFVSVDTTSQLNEIFWDKTIVDTNTTDSFKIYKQVLSSYIKIGEVGVHSPSEFIDTTSRPNTVSNLYELSYVNHCGDESPLSVYNQTILLQASIGVGNVVNLSWNQYAGETVNYYVILRDSTGIGNWQRLDSVSSSITAYTDNTPPVSSNVKYMIITNWNLSCTPTLSIKRRSAMSVSGEVSQSNVKKVTITGINEINPLSGIAVYPVPATNIVNIEFAQQIEATLSLENIVGETVYEVKNDADNKKIQLDISNLSEGIYILKIESENNTVYKRIIKM